MNEVLDPANAIGRQVLAEPDVLVARSQLPRAFPACAVPAGIDHQFARVAERLTGGCNELDIPLGVLAKNAPAELHRSKPPLDIAAGGSKHGLGRLTEQGRG